MDRTSPYQVLILDDDVALGELLQAFLQSSGPFQVSQITMGSDLEPRLDASPVDLLLLDFHLPDTTGLDVLDRIYARADRPPVIMMTGKGDQRTGALAIQRGAADYLIKGQDFWPGLASLIEKTIRMHRLQEMARRSMEQVSYQSLLLDNMRDAVVVWDLNGKITFWNPAAYLLFNLKPSEMVGKPVESAYLARFRPLVSSPKPGDTATSETEREFVAENGHSTWISSRMMPLRLPDNPAMILGYMDVSRDITHRKYEQMALRESQKFVQKIIDTTPNIIYIYDLSRGSIVFVNQEVTDVLGYQPAEVQAFTVAAVPQLMHPHDQEQVADLFKKIQDARDGTVNEFEYRLRHKQGQWRWLHSRESVFSRNGQGKPSQIIGVAQDITERKSNEAKMQKTQAQLVQSARLSAIGQLATGVAHQISNPLTSVLGEAQYLLQTLPKDHPLRESIKAIETAGWRAQWAVDILTRYSEPPTNTIGSVELRQTIEMAVSLVGVNLQSGGVNIEMQLTGKSPQVHGNIRQLESLWVNLLLFIRSIINNQSIRTLRIRSVDLGSYTAVDVEINDLQVTEEQLTAVFDPSLATISSEDISGMEFSICQEIARQNRGSIQVSRIEKNTTFRVTLPTES